jgi:RimJ/RimL family protein N-acetyltransferase
MTSQPTIETDRLLLRPFAETDADWVQAFAGSRDVARSTQNIPHPYEPGMAATWIGRHASGWESGEMVVYAITRREDEAPVGAIGLTVEPANGVAELGYWIGPPMWGRGYATEAAGRLVEFGFRQWKLHRIMARHFGSNPASGRVLQKIGMVHEGTLREHHVKWDRREDIVVYAALASEFGR